MTIDGVASLAESDPLSSPSDSGHSTVLRDAWDAHAKAWIDWVRAPGRPDSYWRFHRQRFLPLVPAPGRLTLDIGCGEGRVARDLQKRGHRLLGVDWSFTMCEAAASHWENPCRVIVGDAGKLPLADASADCAVAFMSLQDIDDLPGAVKEISRVLADGQKLALAIVHPMYSGGTFSAAGKTSDDNFVIQRSYFKPELCISSDSRDSLTVTFYREHRPLQAYIQALLDAGFSIDKLHEVTDEDERKPWHRVPMFLDILATRRPREKPANAEHQPASTPYAAARPLRRNGRDHRPGGHREHRRLRHSPLSRVSSARRVLAVYAAVPFSLGLIGVAAAIAWLAVSHLCACRFPASHTGLTAPGGPKRRRAESWPGRPVPPRCPSAGSIRPFCDTGLYRSKTDVDTVTCGLAG